MLVVVPREGGVVGFDIDLEIVLEAVGAEETDDGLSVVVVLVFGGLTGLGLDEELSSASDLGGGEGGGGGAKRSRKLE